MTTVTISLPESLKEFIDVEVHTKGYGNVSEYVRGLLRAEQAKRADDALETLLLEGLATGEDIALTPAFWKELKADATQILARKKAFRMKRAAVPVAMKSTRNARCSSSLSERLMSSVTCRSCAAAKAEDEVDESPGYYAILAGTENCLPSPLNEGLRAKGTNLLYVGIAKRSLRNRLVDQDLRHRNPSTFFRSLGSVLGYSPRRGSLVGARHNNYEFDAADTKKIIEWINLNIHVRWIPESPSLPAKEKDAIRQLCPSLNIAHNPEPVSELVELRKRCLAIARQAPGR